MEIDEIKEQIEKNLAALFKKMRRENKYPETKLLDAMEYSVMNGGKRIRPIMCLLASELIQSEIQKEITFLALALELIHSYSLIHDDLPCMDNDELRRGRPTTHIKFGEATALLAGDALLNLSFEVALKGLRMSKEPLKYTRALAVVYSESGYNGMIGGQELDLSLEGEPIVDETYNNIIRMYEGKTAGLFIGSILGGAIASGASEENINNLYDFAYCLGLSFQIRDDILEATSTTEQLGKSVESDKSNEKLTLLKASSIEDANRIYTFYSEKAMSRLNKFEANNGKLVEMYNYLLNRQY